MYIEVCADSSVSLVIEVQNEISRNPYLSPNRVKRFLSSPKRGYDWRIMKSFYLVK